MHKFETQYHNTCCAIFCNISKINSLRENRCIVIDVFEVDLHICIANKAFSSLVLGKDCESPLRPAKGLISVQRLQARHKHMKYLETVVIYLDVTERYVLAKTVRAETTTF